MLHTIAGLASIAGKEESQVARVVKRCGVQHHALQIIGQTLPVLLGGLARVGGKLPEIQISTGQNKTFAFVQVSCRVAPQQMEGAVVGEKDLAVVVEVIAYLLSCRNGGQVSVERLHFDCTARRLEAPKRNIFRSTLELVASEEAAIRNPAATVCKLNKDGDSGF